MKYSKYTKAFFRIIVPASILFIVLSSAGASGQSIHSLPRSTPEAEGVSSEGILDFIYAADTSKHEFHSLMLVRNGKVIAESWWDPYRADLKHTMYSISKSFTSTAVGFAVSEGLISVNDSVISFFDEALPDTITPYLRELTIRDLLTMSVGHAEDPTAMVRTGGNNWAETFFSLPIVNEPGTKFLYNSLATYMTSAIVQKVTGQKVIDYLQPRLFEPLGIQGIDWEVSPAGINTGGWGLRVKTEDMAKLGLLYLNKGRWDGKQILPESWVEEATSAHIQQAPDASKEQIASSDWLQGYGYQFWRTRHNAFRADGAYGQFIVVLPDLDAVLVLTAEAPDMQGEINIAWEHLLHAFHDEPLPVNQNAHEALQNKLKSLLLSLPNEGSSPLEGHISGQTFMLYENDLSLQSVAFVFDENNLELIFKAKTAIHQIDFGSGEWEMGETMKPGPYLLQQAAASLTGISPFKVAGAYTWLDDSTLELTLRYIQSPHTEKIVCRFIGNRVEIESRNSFNPNTIQYELSGER